MAAAPRRPNGNGYDNATLRVRVDALGEDMRVFREEMHEVRGSMATRADISILGDQISGLAAKQDNLSRPNWQMWSVAVVVFGLIGSVLYWPINRDTSRLDVAVQAILDRGVFQRQYDADQGRTSQNLIKLQDEWNQTILTRRYDTDQARQTVLNDRMVSKVDMEQALVGVRGQASTADERLQFVITNFLHTKEFDAQHGDLKASLKTQIENLQRQITAVELRINDTWNARDALLALRQRIEHMEHK